MSKPRCDISRDMPMEIYRYGIWIEGKVDHDPRFGLYWTAGSLYQQLRNGDPVRVRIEREIPLRVVDGPERAGRDSRPEISR